MVMLHVGVCCAVVSVPCSLVVTCGKELTSWLSFLLFFVIFPNVSLSTTELRVRLAP